MCCTTQMLPPPVLKITNTSCIEMVHKVYNTFDAVLHICTNKPCWKVPSNISTFTFLTFFWLCRFIFGRCSGRLSVDMANGSARFDLHLDRCSFQAQLECVLQQLNIDVSMQSTGIWAYGQTSRILLTDSWNQIYLHQIILSSTNLTFITSITTNNHNATNPSPVCTLHLSVHLHLRRTQLRRMSLDQKPNRCNLAVVELEPAIF